MINLPGILFAIALLVIMQLLVVTATERTRALMQWRSVIAILALLWWVTPFVKKAYVDEVFYPNDSIVHEETAREIAYLMTNGDWQNARDYFGFGNEGYRFVLGGFYALTNAPEVTTYGIQGFLGFWGMLTVLEIVCLQTNARRVPFWVVLFLLANPSAIFWMTFNLKEGAMLWGICMMLRIALRFGETARKESMFWPALGLLVAGFLRPHIVMAYLAALAFGVAVRQRRIGIAIVTSVGMIAALMMLKTMAPVMFERLADNGIGTTLTEKFHELNATGGSAITYARGAPIPFVSGFILINLRPFPWEVTDITTIAAGCEIWLITGASLLGWYLLPNRTRLLNTSYVLTLVVAVIAISFYFTYMYNMGLMVRQRVMAFPALISLAVLPTLAMMNPSAQRAKSEPRASGLPRTHRAPFDRVHREPRHALPKRRYGNFRQPHRPPSRG